MADKENESRCRGVMRSLQFGWNDYQGVRRPQIVARFELLDGDDKGKLDTWFASMSEDLTAKGDKTYCDHTVESLRACGWTGCDLSELPTLVDAGKLSCEVVLVRVHKMKDGKANTLIKYVNKLGAAKVDLKGNAMGAGDVADLAKRMRGRLGESAQADDAVPAPPPYDPDLPF